jgi:hypothetical protein
MWSRCRRRRRLVQGSDGAAGRRAPGGRACSSRVRTRGLTRDEPARSPTGPCSRCACAAACPWRPTGDRQAGPPSGGPSRPGLVRSVRRQDSICAHPPNLRGQQLLRFAGHLRPWLLQADQPDAGPRGRRRRARRRASTASRPMRSSAQTASTARHSDRRARLPGLRTEFAVHPGPGTDPSASYVASISQPRQSAISAKAPRWLELACPPELTRLHKGRALLRIGHDDG